ncbi:alpha/beta fold hydrolase [Aeromonas dhakensis]|uniref:alpha/beta fold hydrolase n=1 Tax=Aeromonas dhakensis TaxID=196024 RepID=UPI001FA47FE9|nr:acetoin dehydrogenase E2 subunit dihydrolipoyllysine-residue acetyltransferase [Aeromonas hydrophila]
MINHVALSSESKTQERWQFTEEPPLPARYFSEAFDTYQLEARVLPTVRRETEWPQLLAIHGARSDYTKLNAILYPLQTLGIASLSVNLSGHNPASSIGLEETSLGKNMQEALRYADHLAPHLHTVLGHSLGGALALKVAQVHRASVKKIVLFCPALYPEEAYHRRFGSAFKEAISTPFGFLDSHSLTFLREFKGDLMLIIGQYDGLISTNFGGLAGQAAGRVTLWNTSSEERNVYSAIPFEVIDAIEQSLAPKRFEKIVLPDCDHAISSWLRTHPSHAHWVAGKVAAFIGMT